MAVTAETAAGTGFALLVASRFTSTFAYATSWVLLPLFVYQSSGSAVAAGVASAANVIPFLLFGMFAGAAVDRSSPVRVMAWMEATNAVVLLGVPLLAMFEAVGPVTLCVIGFASASVYVWFDVASSAAVPALVGQDNLFRANSQLWMTTTVLTAVAAPIGYFLADALRPGPTFAVLGACYLASAVLVSRIRLPVTEPTPREPGAVRAGWHFLTTHPLLRTYTAVNVGVGISAGAVYGMIIVFAAEALGLPAGDHRVAWIIAASAVGALIGAALAPRFKLMPPVPVARWMTGLDLVLLVTYALVPNWILAAITLLCWNAVHTCFLVVGLSVRQSVTPQRLQGRVNAVGRMIVWGSVPVGTLLCGWLTEMVGPRLALTSLAIFALAGFAIAVRSPQTLTLEGSK